MIPNLGLGSGNVGSGSMLPRASEIVKEALADLLGDAAGRATLFYLGGDDVLSDRVKLRKGLRTIFGKAGSGVLLDSIDETLRERGYSRATSN